jgi:Predicted membrane protein (DUF2142)
VFLVPLLLVCAQGAAWAFATPLLAGPDEPSHIITAAADVRGQLIKPEVANEPKAIQSARLPLTFADAQNESLCLELSNGPANCQLPPTQCRSLTGSQDATCGLPAISGARIESATTYTGRYPPLYYLFVGGPSLLWTSSRVIYVMRLLSVLLSALLIAAALYAVRRWSTTPMVVGGLALALTPSAVYLTAVINPNGFEIASAISVWVSGMVLVRGQWEEPPKLLVAIIGVCLALLLLARASSPVWAVLIVVLLALASRKATWAPLVRSAAVRWWTAIVAVVGVIAVGSIEALHSSIVLPAGQTEAGVSLVTIAKTALGQSNTLLREMIGVLGWNNAPVPLFTTVIWYAGLVFVVVMAASAVRATGVRPLSAILATAAVTVAAPVLYNVATARTSGYLFNGRYTLPIAVGVAVVASALAPVSVRGWLRGVGVLTVLIALANVVAFAWVLRRYMVGEDGPSNPFAHVAGHWSPPIPLVALVLLFAAIEAVTMLWLWSVAKEIHARQSGLDPGENALTTSAGSIH